MDRTEKKFKIFEIIIRVLIPLSIVYLSYTITKRTETLKSEMLKKDQWETKWSEHYFDSYKLYLNDMTYFLSEISILIMKSQEGSQNSEEGLELQKEINTTLLNIYKESLILKLQSISLFGEENEITTLIDSIYQSVSLAAKTKSINIEQIFRNLITLDTLSRKSYNKIINK